MAKNKLNLGTSRPSDDILQPEDLTTPAGGRAVAPWAHITAKEGGLSPTYTEEHILCGGNNADLSETPDTRVIDSDIAHSAVLLTPQSRKGVREQYGGGSGGPRRDVSKR